MHSNNFTNHPHAKHTSTFYHISLVAIRTELSSLKESHCKVEEEDGQRQIQEVEDRIVGNLEPKLSFLRIRNRRKGILHQNHADSHHIVLHVLLPVQLLHVKVEQRLVPLVELLVKLWHVVVFKIELLVGEEENHVTVLLDFPVQLLNSAKRRGGGLLETHRMHLRETIKTHLVFLPMRKRHRSMKKAGNRW